MALYTICATDERRTARPCAIVDAVDEREALREAERLRRTGELLFLPARLHLTARRTSRREQAAFLAFLAQRAPGLLPATDPGATFRSQLRARIFFEKLWRDEVDHDIGG